MHNINSKLERNGEPKEWGKSARRERGRPFPAQGTELRAEKHTATAEPQWPQHTESEAEN